MIRYAIARKSEFDLLALKDKRDIASASTSKTYNDLTISNLSSIDFYIIELKEGYDIPESLKQYEIFEKHEMQSITDAGVYLEAGAFTTVEVRISEEVLSDKASAETYVVPDGKLATIVSASASASFTSNAVVKVIWDYKGGGEEIIWSMKGESNIPFQRSVTGDGVKKLAIEIENTSTGPIWISGSMRVAVEQ